MITLSAFSLDKVGKMKESKMKQLTHNSGVGE